MGRPDQTSVDRVGSRAVPQAVAGVLRGAETTVRFRIGHSDADACAIDIPVQSGVDAGQLAARAWAAAKINVLTVDLERNRDDIRRTSDQFGIVLYGDTSHVHLDPTVIDASSRSTIKRRIREIESAGSTAMEAGLTLGFRVARESAGAFKGSTRVMLFTDERPNVGNTAAEGFMGMAEAASRDGIGLTTIGVGVQFGAELAARISSVRGGNLFFFPDGEAMKKTFADDFDTMVTELAHEFTVRIAPAAGLRLVGVFGVPGDMLHWDGDALVLDVATIFLSRRKGAIYFALGPDGVSPDLPVRVLKPGEAAAQVDLAYRNASDGARVAATEVCRILEPTKAQAGLSRGARLVDEYLTLKKATTAHAIDNDQETAFRLVHGLLGRLTAARDPALKDELTLVADVNNTLAMLSGHVGEMQPALGEKVLSPLVGVWRRTEAGKGRDVDAFFVFWPNGVIEIIEVDRGTREANRAESIALRGKLPRRARGVLPLAEADRERLGEIRYALAGDALTLEIANMGDGPASYALARCAYAEIEAASAVISGPELMIDDISGLPEIPESRETAALPGEWRIVTR